MAKKYTEKYRDAKTGEFIKESKANRMSPSRVIKESVPKPGYGVTSPKKKK